MWVGAASFIMTLTICNTYDYEYTEESDSNNYNYYEDVTTLMAGAEGGRVRRFGESTYRTLKPKDVEDIKKAIQQMLVAHEDPFRSDHVTVSSDQQYTFLTQIPADDAELELPTTQVSLYNFDNDNATTAALKPKRTMSHIASRVTPTRSTLHSNKVYKPTRSTIRTPLRSTDRTLERSRSQKPPRTTIHAPNRSIFNALPRAEPYEPAIYEPGTFYIPDEAMVFEPYVPIGSLEQANKSQKGNISKSKIQRPFNTPDTSAIVYKPESQDITEITTDIRWLQKEDSYAVDGYETTPVRSVQILPFRTGYATLTTVKQDYRKDTQDVEVMLTNKKEKLAKKIKPEIINWRRIPYDDLRQGDDQSEEPPAPPEDPSPSPEEELSPLTPTTTTMSPPTITTTTSPPTTTITTSPPITTTTTSPPTTTTTAAITTTITTTAITTTISPTTTITSNTPPPTTTPVISTTNTATIDTSTTDTSTTDTTMMTSNATTTTQTSELLRTTMNTTTTVKPEPRYDVEKFLEIIKNLTHDYETDLVHMVNDSLKRMSFPTCGPTTPPTTLPWDYGFNKSIVAKCFVCGLKTPGIPYEASCADAFAGDFLPLVPQDPRAKSKIARFRKYCRYGDFINYWYNTSQPRTVFGRWTGGCSVRWTDITGVYTQRTCRNRRRAVTGRHYASKRMAKLEMALSNVDNGCIVSPVASLLPLSRSISLFARFHACVCMGNWCNTAVWEVPPVPALITAVIVVLVFWKH